MTLNPTVRWLLVGLATAATAAATILADGFQPIDVLPILIAFLTGIGITPPTAQTPLGAPVEQKGNPLAPILKSPDVNAAPQNRRAPAKRSSGAKR